MPLNVQLLMKIYQNTFNFNLLYNAIFIGVCVRPCFNLNRFYFQFEFKSILNRNQIIIIERCTKYQSWQFCLFGTFNYSSRFISGYFWGELADKPGLTLSLYLKIWIGHYFINLIPYSPSDFRGCSSFDTELFSCLCFRNRNCRVSSLRFTRRCSRKVGALL